MRAVGVTTLYVRAKATNAFALLSAGISRKNTLYCAACLSLIHIFSAHFTEVTTSLESITHESMKREEKYFEKPQNSYKP